MLALVQGASVSWVKEKINKAMQEHVVAFLDLRKTLDKSYRLELGEEQTVDPETMLSTWLEIMDVSLLGESTIIEEPKPKTVHKASVKIGELNVVGKIDLNPTFAFLNGIRITGKGLDVIVTIREADDWRALAALCNAAVALLDRHAPKEEAEAVKP